MDTWASLLLVFILSAMVVIAVAILVALRVKARLSLPGRAEFYIETEKGWKPLSVPSRARQPGERRRTPEKAASLPRYRLVARVRDGPDWEYPLDGKPVVYIGRRKDNDIVLRDETADTHQAVIYWEKGRYRINNLSKDIPTRVNDRPITWQNLGDGNTIQTGRTKLIFRERK